MSVSLRPRLAPQPNPLRDMLMTALRVGLGAVFLWAAHDKILNPAAFAKIVHDYQLLPDALVNLTALLLPWIEVVAGLALIFNVMGRAGAVIILCLLLVFLAALGFNYSRGLNVACGCFSTKAQPSSLALELARDLGLLLVSLLVTAHLFKRR